MTKRNPVIQALDLKPTSKTKNHIDLMTVENINRILWEDRFSKLCKSVNLKFSNKNKMKY